MFSAFAVLLLAVAASPTHLRLEGRLGAQRRSTLSGALTDSSNLAYSTSVTLNGSSFSVTIDTGSSDLWVSSSVPGAVYQNYQASVSYASGSASGNVMSATLDFDGFSVPDQFFIEAPQASVSGADGLIGLGPSSGSVVRQLGASSAADPPLDRIFTSNSSVSPFITILLQRSNDPGDPYPGDVTVGRALLDHQDILNQPRLPVTVAPLQGGQHWQTLLDVDGIVGPNGKQIQIKTQVAGAQTQNATVIFDSGFSLPQVSPSVANALYSDIPGAVLANISSVGEVWALPCNQPVNITFLFGGVQFPIHPLDSNFDGFDLTVGGKAFCVGAFQPYSFDIKENGEVLFDMVLGMAFLRNAYLLINFGDLLNAAAPSTDTAFIQLLPMTNATQAAQDFASVRKGTGDATADEIKAAFGSSGSSHSASKLTPLEIGLIAAGGLALLLLVTCLACCCCRRRRPKNGTAPATVWPANRPGYRPIHDPSPQAAYEMHLPSGAPPRYTPVNVPEYRTAWDARY